MSSIREPMGKFRSSNAPFLSAGTTADCSADQWYFCVTGLNLHSNEKSMTKLVRPLVCTECAKQKTDWTEDCPHAIELWQNGYIRALQERARPRLTSEDVRKALSPLSPSWQNFYHLAADTLNRILDEKEKSQRSRGATP